MTEHGVFAIQMRTVGQRDEELAIVCVWSTVCHTYKSRCIQRAPIEILVVEFGAEDGNSACSVACSNVSTLNHEFVNDAMERCAFVR